ncbi:MAG: phosphonate ABC transporter, permease protein PhnE [Oligoflexia bacterium]|nr:phosphonate ABC transporter, permease protein PhnE [Oligoflexia bacterium]
MTDTTIPPLPSAEKRTVGNKELQEHAESHIFERFMTLKYFIIISGTALFLWSARAVEFDLAILWANRSQLWDFITGMFPPDMEIAKQVFDEVVVTIQLAFVGTVIATIISIPLGFMAASNVMPQTKTGKSIVAATRFLLNADRAIDAVILALFFAGAVGLGPFAGTLALAIHSIGMLGKLFYEAIETVDKGPIEAVESVGAGRLSMIRWAVIPQVIPYFITYFLFRFELNIRSAVVLGVVGAGGIGFLLQSYMKLFQYQRTCTVVLVILVLVMSLDAFSTHLRKKLIGT